MLKSVDADGQVKVFDIISIKAVTQVAVKRYLTNLRAWKEKEKRENMKPDEMSVLCEDLHPRPFVAPITDHKLPRTFHHGNLERIS